ncbi:MaoC family dehydratase [Phenylobacterium immobile]|uniref:MaoC family dehydratase n=1 Tax=Phenylobacterium immobile TaxID=21 RepID=UPI000A47E8E8|nr:MaoC family dehydratase [Phenylobacterium immobile]
MAHPDRYLDDLKVGEVWLGQPFEITEAEIIEFARAYDPQPMHIDPEAAARGRFGGLIASGWHVASRVMREFVDESPFGATPMLGLRIDELCWLKTVRPGDRLRVRREILEVVPSKSRADRGVVRTATTVTNQDGELVMSFFTLIQVPANAGTTL